MENQYDHNTMTKMISDIIKVDLHSINFYIALGGQRGMETEAWQREI